MVLVRFNLTEDESATCLFWSCYIIYLWFLRKAILKRFWCSNTLNMFFSEHLRYFYVMSNYLNNRFRKDSKRLLFVKFHGWMLYSATAPPGMIYLQILANLQPVLHRKLADILSQQICSAIKWTARSNLLYFVNLLIEIYLYCTLGTFWYKSICTVPWEPFVLKNQMLLLVWMSRFYKWNCSFLCLHTFFQLKI